MSGIVMKYILVALVVVLYPFGLILWPEITYKLSFAIFMITLILFSFHWLKVIFKASAEAADEGQADDESGGQSDRFKRLFSGGTNPPT